jgi:peptide/nickel transport system substrate-binding protein
MHQWGSRRLSDDHAEQPAPPFDNPKVREAVLLALDQQSFVEAVVGDQKDLANVFAPTMLMANSAGMERLTGPRDIARARKAVAVSGYKGEPAMIKAPSDQPAMAQMSQVARDLFQSISLNVDYRVMDWGSVLTRLAS